MYVYVTHTQILPSPDWTKWRNFASQFGALRSGILQILKMQIPENFRRIFTLLKICNILLLGDPEMREVNRLYPSRHSLSQHLARRSGDNLHAISQQLEVEYWKSKKRGKILSSRRNLSLFKDLPYLVDLTCKPPQLLLARVLWGDGAYCLLAARNIQKYLRNSGVCSYFWYKIVLNNVFSLKKLLML